MNAVPDAIVQHILSNVSNARDVAACTCVSKQWKECIPFVPSLFFPRSAFDGARHAEADAIIGHMVSSAVRLEELVIYCPFSTAGLASWLTLHCRSLCRLELRMDGTADKALGAEAPTDKLDCIGSVKGLEALKLWGVTLARPPRWGAFERLRTLEIIGAAMGDNALQDAIHACPNLTDLALLGCDGVSSLSIELERLENCRMDFLSMGDCSLSLSSPSLKVLEIQGFAWVYVHPRHRLRSLCIAKNSGTVYKVDVGKLQGLEYMSLRGIQWSWNAISSILQCASEVKHLVMKIEFTGNLDMLQPFPQIDLVEFFNNHPMLHSFEIHGAMFAALCQKNSLKNLDSKFVIPRLEEVLITVRSPLNAEQKLNTLRSLLKYSVNLRKMVIRISQMRNCHDIADGFFKDICKFQYMNQGIVRIE